jgi:hypothetical protein
MASQPPRIAHPASAAGPAKARRSCADATGAVGVAAASSSRRRACVRVEKEVCIRSTSKQEGRAANGRYLRWSGRIADCRSEER